ncbi:MAG TPA: c-type cytochrome [Burkholderiales bacterium]
MNFRLALLAGSVVASLTAGLVVAAEPPSKADPAKGQTTATTVCAACHGADGNSAVPINPKLAAQIPAYIEKQLHDFKADGGKEPVRKNAIMNGMAAGLTPEMMRDVAAFYGTQRIKPEAAKNKELVELGQKIYRAGISEKGVPACASCHGPKGEGVPAQYPRVAGQFAEYTEAQLKLFRSGERANDPNRMMAATATKLSDQEIHAVSDYIAGLR